MENGKNNARSGRGSGLRCFLLLEPRGLCDSGEVAKRIARCRGVREVHLTSGRYGFVVSAGASSNKDVKNISSAVRKASGSKSINVAVSHLVYR